MSFRPSRFFSAFIAALFIGAGCFAQGTEILINHIGYDVSAGKRAVILGHQNDAFDVFKVKERGTGKEVFSGRPESVGPVPKWKDWQFWTADFGEVKQEGVYYIECASAQGSVHSSPFLIQKNILERNALSDVVYYFKGQRCSGLLDKADRRMRFEGRDGVVDVHGGWFDATGDYGKHLSHLSYSTFFNPQQIPLTAWSLFRSHRELERRADPNFRQYLRRLLDEAMFGADFLVRIKNPSGSFYVTISGRGPEKKPEGRLITPKAGKHIILTKETKDKFRDYGRENISGEAVYEAGYREGAGLCIAALAIASTHKASGEFGTADYRKAAEDAFAYLEKNNLHFANDGKENIVDDYCALMAATELFRATNNSIYKEAADRRAKNLIGRLVPPRNYWRADDGDRPFFHPVDAGLPVTSLLEYAGMADETMRRKVLESVQKSLTCELEATRDVPNPFGYSRQHVHGKNHGLRTNFFFPHDTETAPWWQGENARLASMAAAARMAARFFASDENFRDKLRDFANDQLNWILGLNPFDSCMLQGKGRNNPAYMFFDSYEYTNAPGGICNGITAGYKDEEDIDFNLHFAETGKDDDWRWGEQWLPHAAWFLLAVSLGADSGT